MRHTASIMDYLRAVFRACIPFAGIAIIGSLYGDRKFFWDILLLPLAVVIPLISWTTVKATKQARTGQAIAIGYLFVYGFSLIFLAVVVFFSFMAEGIGSHGSYTGPLLLKLLFAFTIIVIIPCVDLVMYRCSQISDVEKIKRIKHATILIRVIFVVFITFSLIRLTWPPVNMALRQHYRSIAITLIDSGLDINTKDGWHCAPLWYAVNRVDLEMATLLLKKGAKLDQTIASFGLQRAVGAKNTDMLSFLLKNGADPNSTYMGAPPLVTACQSKDTTMIRILLESGADINLKSKYPNMPYDGKSPIDIAYESNDAKVVNLLLNHGKKH